MALAAYFPTRFRESALDVTSLLANPDADLVRLINDLVAEVEPDPALVAAVAARDEDTQDFLREGLSGEPPVKQARQVLWDLAEKELL